MSSLESTVSSSSSASSGGFVETLRATLPTAAAAPKAKLPPTGLTRYPSHRRYRSYAEGPYRLGRRRPSFAV